MSVTSQFTRLRQRWQRFRSARGGNVAITFAIALIPMVGAVGAAVDYSHANSIKAAMQAALDSTALMLAKQAATMTDEQLQASANDYFKAVFNRPEMKGVAVTAQLSSSNGYALTVTGSGVLKPDFLGIMGISQLNVTANAVAISNAGGLGCVLALNRSASGAITAQGSTTVVLDGCSMYDNSNSGTALTVGGSAKGAMRETG